MHQARHAMMAGAAAAQQVLSAPEVAQRWDDPSALEGFSVGGLAAHVTTVLSSSVRVCDDPDATEEPQPPEAYYTTFTLTDAESDANADIVAHGEQRARYGAAATAQRFAEQLQVLRGRLDDVPQGRTVQIFGLVPMRLEDFFVTRALEFWVHADDLACSVGIDTPEVDPVCAEVVLWHLASVARFRHGDVAVLRAFTRRERDAVHALQVL